MTKKEEAFQVAINQFSKMDIIYVNQEGARLKRRIWPLEFHNTQGKWRCLAWCEYAQAIRTFKMAGVISYKVTSRKFDKNEIDIIMVKPDPTVGKKLEGLEKVMITKSSGPSETKMPNPCGEISSETLDSGKE